LSRLAKPKAQVAKKATKASLAHFGWYFIVRRPQANRNRQTVHLLQIVYTPHLNFHSNDPTTRIAKQHCLWPARRFFMHPSGCAFKYACAYVHTHTNIHTYVRTYIHTYIHTNICVYTYAPLGKAVCDLAEWQTCVTPLWCSCALFVYSAGWPACVVLSALYARVAGFVFLLAGPASEASSKSA